jgi:hypothetical protein
MDNLPDPPNQVPLMTGKELSTEWRLWFQRVYDAIIELQNAP